ncbi:glycosyltransferase family 32 protein [Serendipita vermifera MAFF 305830]|uniref:Glycosyltransferase family 32 protein n=1 Tax=Serendipita vermifera MAFF 305830 TaxID=933852 RepID=A0A0C2XXT8_SERVB|nr:glycosyltransferase family 32 protein [Serendipita vermifera MAFF 305830]
MPATSFLRSRSTSPIGDDSDDEKLSRRYSRRESAEWFRPSGRIFRSRSILLAVIASALFGVFVTMGPLKSTYEHGKCQAAIYISGIPKVQPGASNATSSRPEYASYMEGESQWAKAIHPDELMEKLERGETIEAKLIHQSWKTRNDVPPNFEDWGRQWRKLHGPDWKYVLWTDEDNLKLVQKFYPEFLQTYQNLPREIYRADMVRNMYMHRFGGLYADLDLIPLSSITEHLPVFNSSIPAPMRIAYVGRMSKETFEHSIPNAFMASTSAGHPFWLRPLSFVQDNISDSNYNRQPEELTGPVALRRCVSDWQDQVDERNGAGQYDEVRVIEGGKIYPFTWNDSPLSAQCICWPRNPTFDSQRCHQLYPNAWTITYWTHTWG